MQITVVHHPLLQVKMSVLRDINTNCPTFRRVIGEVAMLLTFEATKNIPLETHPVATPLAETTGHSIKGTVNVIPILRAGLGFLEGVLSVLPEANVGPIGMDRDEENLEPVEY